MDLNILAKGLATSNEEFTPSIEDYSWISNVFVVKFKGKYGTFLLNGVNNPINDDYYNTMFYNSDLFAVKLVSYTYLIDEIQKFEKDYRNIIFKMFLKNYLDVKIEDFNMYNFNLNKIFQF